MIRLRTLMKMKETLKQVRPVLRPACLFLVCLCVGIYVLLMFQGVRYASSLRRPTWYVAARPTPASTPVPPVSAPEEDPGGGRININAATAEELQALPGIGPVLSNAIVTYRDQIGGFYFPEELLQVSGIGEKRFAAIQDLIFCPWPTETPPAVPAMESASPFAP